MDLILWQRCTLTDYTLPKKCSITITSNTSALSRDSAQVYSYPLRFLNIVVVSISQNTCRLEIIITPTSFQNVYLHKSDIFRTGV